MRLAILNYVAIDPPFVFVTGSWDVSNGAAGSLLGLAVGAGVVQMDGAGCLSSRRPALCRLSAAGLNVFFISISLRPWRRPL